MKVYRVPTSALRFAAAPPAGGLTLPSRVRVIVPVSKLHTPTLRALAFARASRPHSLVAVTVRTSTEETAQVMEEWAQREIPVPLVILESPYRELTQPVVQYIREIHRQEELAGPRPADEEA